MGEYGIRLSDKEEIKIGTCTGMYYVTLPQIFQFKDKGSKSCRKNYITNYLNEMSLRLHVLEEKDIKVGDYRDWHVDHKNTRIVLEVTDDDIEFFKENPGTVHIPVPLNNSYDNSSGLYVNVKCMHGYNSEERDENNVLKTYYNGRVGDVFSLDSVMVIDKEIHFVIVCGICGKRFSITYDEFLKSTILSGASFGSDQKKYINNTIYNLQFDEKEGKYFKEIIDFDKLVLL